MRGKWKGRRLGSAGVQFGQCRFSTLQNLATCISYYDSMISKIIAHAPSRLTAINKMRGALDELYIEGVNNNIDLQLSLFKQHTRKKRILHLFGSFNIYSTFIKIKNIKSILLNKPYCSEAILLFEFPECNDN